MEGAKVRGSTGAILVEDDEGTRWIFQDYGGSELQVQDEFVENWKKELGPGARTPDGRTEKGGCVMEDRSINPKGMPGHDFPLCMACRHLRKTGTLSGLGWTCDAFPEGIPVTVVQGIDSHLEPLEGDNGVQFEPEEMERR